jgi:hypothetical protein
MKLKRFPTLIKRKAKTKLKKFVIKLAKDMITDRISIKFSMNLIWKEKVILVLKTFKKNLLFWELNFLMLILMNYIKNLK